MDSDRTPSSTLLMPAKLSATGFNIDVAYQIFNLVLRSDYLSTGRGHQQRRRLLVERSKIKKIPPTAATSTELSSHDAERIYLRAVAQQRRQTSSEEYQLAVRMRAGDLQARNALLQANLGLVVMFARRYRSSGVAFIDLIAEGNIGLLAATREFNPEMGCRFSTYAKWFVKQAIQRALPRLSNVACANCWAWSQRDKQSAPEALPATNEHALQAAAVDQHAADALSAVPDAPELSAGLTASNNEFDDALASLAIPEEEEPPQLALIEQRRISLQRALNGLGERERAIVSERFALQDNDVPTLDELSRRYGVSIERIRQIENAAVGKLKRLLGEAGQTAETLL